MKQFKYLNNRQIVDLLKSVAAAYIVKKGNPFKIKAYQEAAAAVKRSSSEIKDLWDDKKLTEVSGIGKGIASHLDELFRTGEVKHFKAILKGLPEAMFQFIKISGIGPKVAFKLCRKLGITKSKDAFKKLRQACLKGKVRIIEGFGEKSEKEILKSLKEFSQKKAERLLLPKANKIAANILAFLKQCPLVKRVDVLGSLRRKCATVGDIDVAVATSQPKKVIDWFLKYPQKRRVIEAGEKKARLSLFPNNYLDLRVGLPEEYGSLLQHFTGSKQHNIHLRKFAQEKGLSLSEYGIKKIKGEKFKLIKFKTEEDFYNFLDMVWIPPELREDQGEIEMALKKKLPQLIQIKDIKGDLHIHSDFNIETSHDLGLNSMKEIASKAQKLGYEYIAFSEHNPSAGKHNEKEIIDLIKRKKRVIEQLNYSYNNSQKKDSNKLFIFNSLEVDIKPNGSLAIPNKALDILDFAIVAIHSSFKMSKEKMTTRVIDGLNHPKVKILAHPTGRKLNEREGYELDWPQIFNFCRSKNKFLEINAFPDRTDLPDNLIKEAIKQKVKLIINTDSHQIKHLSQMKYGVFNARKGWAEKNDIINSLSYNQIKKMIINE